MSGPWLYIYFMKEVFKTSLTREKCTDSTN